MSSPASAAPLAPFARELLRRHFDLAHLHQDSLSEWSPVYRATTANGHHVVVKPTPGEQPRADATAAWVRQLSAIGVEVVTPLELASANPAEVDGRWWVLYPWVDGAAYDASRAQISAVGTWLGRQHTARVSHGAGMKRYTYPETSLREVEQDLAALADRLEDDSVVRQLAQRWWTTSLPALRGAELPLAAVTGDIKAANFAFTDHGPVMIDPDNAQVQPRIFDLALAVVLFHNECPTAPGQLFDTAQWTTFASAYLSHVDLTAAERRLWPAALEHVLWEEGTWALEDNDQAAWDHPRQGAFLRDLAMTTAERYPLPAQ